jgi:hypothetical protein
MNLSTTHALSSQAKDGDGGDEEHQVVELFVESDYRLKRNE